MAFHGKENQEGLALPDPMPSVSGHQAASLPSIPLHPTPLTCPVLTASPPPEAPRLNEVQRQRSHCILIVQFSSVTQSCPTLCNPMDCSMQGVPVHLHLSEFTQTHTH